MSDLSRLSDRAIIGRFYQTLESGNDAFIDSVAFPVQSDQASETYAWLGQTPMMSEWLGNRKKNSIRTVEYAVKNTEYDTGLEIDERDLRRDKTGQIMIRIDELAAKTNRFRGKLLIEKMIAGEAATCYDGQYFFDTDHSEGASGSQSNDISVDVSELPVTNKGSTTAPSPSQLQHCVGMAIQAILGFKDDQGDPINEEAQSFLCMIPVPYWLAMASALKAPITDGGDSNVLMQMDGFSVAFRPSPRITWTEKFAVFRTDGRVKPFIMQEELPVQLRVLGEGSEYAKLNKKHLYIPEWCGGVGYGYWQHACLVTLT
jgi:phage major head subunit gpT-like protein